MDKPQCEEGSWSLQEIAPRDISRVVMTTSPAFLLMVFMISTGVHDVVTANQEDEVVVPAVRGPGGKLLPMTRRKKKSRSVDIPAFSKTARYFFHYSSALIALSFLANGTAIALHASWDREKTGDIRQSWWAGQEAVVYTIGSAFLYLYFLISLLDWKSGPIVVHFATWGVAMVFEFILLVAITVRALVPHCVKDGGKTVLEAHPTVWDLVDISIGSIRLVFIVGMVALYTCIRLPLCANPFGRSTSDERTPLLSDPDSPASPADYDSLPGSELRNESSTCGGANGSAQRDQVGVNGQEISGCARDVEAAFYRPTKLPHKSWYEYIRGYGLFFPYLWPKGNLRLQFFVLLCFLIMIAQRVVNFMFPLQMGFVINALLREHDTMPLREVAWLIVFKALQGSSGLLGSVRSWLWIPVSQYSYRSLTTASFEHVHALSLDFHLSKRTGEVLSALNKGSAINSFMEQVTFQVFPMLFDIIFAITCFYVKYNVVYAVLVAIITFYYLFITIRMAAARTDQRRDMVNADREEEAVKNDSITSYETVKYFNAESYEFQRYRNVIHEFQGHEAKYLLGMSIMNTCQSLVFMCGLLVVVMLGAWEVSKGLREVGSFVTLLTYLQQLQGPLNFFGTFYRTVQQAMISAERLLELFKVQPTVVDRPEAVQLCECTGYIRWSGVIFSYGRGKPALHEMSFECLPGTTTAFVGESGGGKSTVFRLMYRYYDTMAGMIQIDRHNVKDLTIDSVRKHIGVVPQDTNLFNETLMYNLKYANQNATDEDIYAACRAAHIHDKILSFPDGYDTKVGERGLRLSGGEKQRVAIARTLLKDPKIIMLDEATSALDSSTEQQIQKELRAIARGRTLLIIAHRLSTVVHADQILVLHAGRIVEKGTHNELLALGGRYTGMWEKQSKAEEAEKAAFAKRAEAKRLLQEAGIPTAEPSDRPTLDEHNRRSKSSKPSH